MAARPLLYYKQYWPIRFPGYNASQSLADNLRHNWPLNPSFDVVFAMYTWLRPTNFSRQAAYPKLPGQPLFARMEHEIDVSADQARQDLLDDARLRMIRFTAYTAYVAGPIGACDPASGAAHIDLEAI